MTGRAGLEQRRRDGRRCARQARASQCRRPAHSPGWRIARIARRNGEAHRRTAARASAPGTQPEWLHQGGPDGSRLPHRNAGEARNSRPRRSLVGGCCLASSRPKLVATWSQKAIDWLDGDHRRGAEGDREVIVPLRLHDGLDADAPTTPRLAARSILPAAAAGCAPHSGALLCRDFPPHSGRGF